MKFTQMESATTVHVIDETVAQARDALLACQESDGHWLFELEADVTIPAEYILLQHYLDEVDSDEERALAAYIRATQAEHGGWPLFEGGEPNISASVKAYYALKLAGDHPDAPHMRRARDVVLRLGGAARANVFTRFALALFGQVPWRAVPVMPVEIMLLPRWFPFHIEKVSYWSRTVVVPLLVLTALRPRARNPHGIGIPELFTTPAELEPNYVTSPPGARLGPAFVGLDKILSRLEPHFPKGARKRAIERAMAFITPRLNGEDGLGAIFPAMANAVMAFDALGYPRDDPAVLTAKAAIRKLLVKGERTYCQPCVSPVWDTCLAMHALAEAGAALDGTKLANAADWLLDREITHVKGDWAWRRPHQQPGGWAFQYRNDYYPDVDDTAVVAMALHRLHPERYRNSVERAASWIIALQSKNGGWGAFDADNTYHYLNAIPFADHGALLDPPTVDVTARCVSMLGQLGYRDHIAVRRGIEFLKREQEPDGSWHGRWGVNYVYGTWSALCALNAAGEDLGQPAVRRAVAWLEARQREDGGWGEDCRTYWGEHRGHAPTSSTPSQTAWALLGLMAVGEVDGEAVRRGVSYLQRARRIGARWEEKLWTGVGFPRVFYLKYHGYAAYFPLLALARYTNLVRSNERRVKLGM